MSRAFFLRWLEIAVPVRPRDILFRIMREAARLCDFPPCFLGWMQYATTMKSIHIRDVPETTIERLKRRAVRHHRSLQGELQFLLEQAAREVAADEPSEFSLHTVRTQGGQNWSRDAVYED